MAAPSLEWRVASWNHGFKVKTTSPTFTVKKHEFVVDAYADGHSETARGELALYARYVGRAKTLMAKVWFEVDGRKWGPSDKTAVGARADAVVRTRVGCDALGERPAVVRCWLEVTEGRPEKPAMVLKVSRRASLLTQMARNMRFNAGVAPIAWKYYWVRKRARKMRLALKKRDRTAYYAERTLLWDQEHERSADSIRALFEKMGGVYNKLAQDWATRDGLIPEAWVGALRHSFESLKPRPWPKMSKLMYDGLKSEGAPIANSSARGLAQYFQWINPEPLAAASIGQVHVARRYGSQEKVIVKAIYPEIRKNLLADLANARIAAQFVTRVLKLPMKGSVDAIMDEYYESFPRELDLRLEAGNITKARELFEKHEIDVDVPAVFEDLSCSAVLSQSFVHGDTIATLMKRELTLEDRQVAIRAVTRVAEAVGVTMFRDNWFHSDPHPGNIMLDLESGRIGLIDWGQCCTLTDAQLRTVCHIVLLLHSKSSSLVEKVLNASDFNFNTESKDLKVSLLYFIFDSSRDVPGVVTPEACDYLRDAIQHNPRSMPVLTDVPREMVFYGRVCSTLRKSFEVMGATVSVVDLWYEEARRALKRLNADAPDLTSSALLFLPDNPAGLVNILDNSPDWISHGLQVVSTFASESKVPPTTTTTSKALVVDTHPRSKLRTLNFIAAAVIVGATLVFLIRPIIQGAIASTVLLIVTFFATTCVARVSITLPNVATLLRGVVSSTTGGFHEEGVSLPPCPEQDVTTSSRI